MRLVRAQCLSDAHLASMRPVLGARLVRMWPMPSACLGRTRPAPDVRLMRVWPASGLSKSPHFSS